MGVNNYSIAVPGVCHTDIYTDAQFNNAREDWETNGIRFVKDMVCSFTTSNKELMDVQNQVSVFPNPSYDHITISIGDIHTAYDLSIYDQLGRKVQATFNITDQNFSLHKSKLGMGFFVAHIVFEDKTIAPVTKQIIFE